MHQHLRIRGRVGFVEDHPDVPEAMRGKWCFKIQIFFKDGSSYTHESANEEVVFATELEAQNALEMRAKEVLTLIEQATAEHESITGEKIAVFTIDKKSGAVTPIEEWDNGKVKH
jgi:hypothetical protein